MTFEFSRSHKDRIELFAAFCLGIAAIFSILFIEDYILPRSEGVIFLPKNFLQGREIVSVPKKSWIITADQGGTQIKSDDISLAQFVAKYDKQAGYHAVATTIFFESSSFKILFATGLALLIFLGLWNHFARIFLQRIESNPH